MNNFPTTPVPISDYPLCDECKDLGYCKEKMAISKALKVSSSIPDELTKIVMPQENKEVATLKELLSLVPLQVLDSRFGDYSKKHLQTAYDEFHQEDYETALLHFLTVIETNSNVSDAYLGAAISYYMLGNFEMAFGYSHYLDGKYGKGSELLLKFFFDLCATEIEKTMSSNLLVKI